MDDRRDDERRTELTSRSEATGAEPSEFFYHDTSNHTPAREENSICGAHHKPHLHDLLRSIHLDVHYHRAQGDQVYYLDELGREIEVLDLIGGYGTLLFGHGHPELTNEAIRYLSSFTCSHAQGSISRLAASLAAELSRRAEAIFV